MRIPLMTLALSTFAMGCGVTQNHSDEKIVSGAPVTAGDLVARSTVALIEKGANSFDGNVFCTGTLIDEGWILTAAHCVWPYLNWEMPPANFLDRDQFNDQGWAIVQRDPSCMAKLRQAYFTPPASKIYMTFGGKVEQENNGKTSLNPGLNYIPIDVNRENIFIHPEYDGENMVAEPGSLVDLALIRIPAGAKLPSFARPVAVPSLANFQSVLRPRQTELIIAGYGSMRTTLKLFDPVRTCEHIITMGVEMHHENTGSLRKRTVKYTQRLGQSFIVSEGACKGDSGGPAFLLKNDKLFLVGTTSAEYGGDGVDMSDSVVMCVGQQAEYINVPKHISWLQRIMGS